MSYGLFFSIEAIGRAVDSAEPESCSGKDTILELLASLSIEGDYFGLIDARDTCLQVRFESEQKSYWFEVPRPDLGGSYGARYSFDDAAKILQDVPDYLPQTGFSGFEFSEW